MHFSSNKIYQNKRRHIDGGVCSLIKRKGAWIECCVRIVRGETKMKLCISGILDGNEGDRVIVLGSCACFCDDKRTRIPCRVRIHRNIHHRTNIGIPDRVIGEDAEIISSCAAEIHYGCINIGRESHRHRGIGICCIKFVLKKNLMNCCCSFCYGRVDRYEDTRVKRCFCCGRNKKGGYLRGVKINRKISGYACIGIVGVIIAAYVPCMRSRVNVRHRKKCLDRVEGRCICSSDCLVKKQGAVGARIKIVLRVKRKIECGLGRIQSVFWRCKKNRWCSAVADRERGCVCEGIVGAVVDRPGNSISAVLCCRNKTERVHGTLIG